MIQLTTYVLMMIQDLYRTSLQIATTMAQEHPSAGINMISAKLLNPHRFAIRFGTAVMKGITIVHILTKTGRHKGAME